MIVCPFVVESSVSSTAEASRGVLDLGCGQDFNDCGNSGLNFTGATTVRSGGHLIKITAGLPVGSMRSTVSR